jgi:hypothetical protein
MAGHQAIAQFRRFVAALDGSAARGKMKRPDELALHRHCEELCNLVNRLLHQWLFGDAAHASAAASSGSVRENSRESR